jgi:tRNA threonylcarbamoyladenosine modification (KEOPS) complex  Pcc1 subunit
MIIPSFDIFREETLAREALQRRHNRVIQIVADDLSNMRAFTLGQEE